MMNIPGILGLITLVIMFGLAGAYFSNDLDKTLIFPFWLSFGIFVALGIWAFVDWIGDDY